MPTQQVALDRDALYYPYIHITDVNWLKATLLCFPSVRRMVPNNFTPNDSREVKEFSELIGPRGPLLSPVDLFSSEATRAEETLKKKLEENDLFIRSHYSKAKTLQEYEDSSKYFLVNDEKIISSLYGYLVSGKSDNDVLAWRTDPPADRPHRPVGQWLAMHPVLGNAILATKAVAIANDLGLDIVTEATAIHQAVVTNREDEIFDQLIGKSVHEDVENHLDQNVDDLAEIVMLTKFDASKLSPKQIADLLADGKDLRAFKNELVSIASSIPKIKNLRERNERLKAAADTVVSNWKKHTKSLPRFALDAISDATEIKWPELVNKLIVGGSAWQIGGGAGLGLFIVSYAGLKVWRKYRENSSSPYAYLSRIAKAQAQSEALLSLPTMGD